jgi:hypothetical protein
MGLFSLLWEIINQRTLKMDTTNVRIGYVGLYDFHSFLRLYRLL